MFRFIALLWFILACFAATAGIHYAREGDVGLAILWGVIWLADCGLSAWNMVLAEEEDGY